MIPASPRNSSGLTFEQKFDGYRALVSTPLAPSGRVLLQTRRGSLVQRVFPDLVAAAEQLSVGLVLDGEVIAWDVGADALSFGGLQRRAAVRAGGASALAASLPVRGQARGGGLYPGGSAAVIMPAVGRSFQLPTPFPTTILGYEQSRGTSWD
ncbi:MULTISPECIES: ATP-dependent DNA ligase [unclassified Streptomyces]|uniref:ATP-dependent DNA ligase n=1 Tax=unclassified Streptomyces TaxID=2593676 RepID=UPI002E30CEDF|nr:MULTISPECIES: hypothetical protein [unclassified Streptomyces]WUC68364.1 hypothetical protein OG861_31265 [Streptomyces sp. NBC_00539]